MSVEEEVELRDLVAQALEANGCLPKLRAQLRANLFLALDEDNKINSQQPLLNKKIKSYLEVPEGQIMFSLVREFLEYFDLDFTVSVYEPESCTDSLCKYEGRQKVMEDLGLKLEDNISGPVLLHLVKIAQTNSKTLKINLANINKESASSSKPSTAPKINGHNNSSDGVSQEQVQLNVTHVVKKVAKDKGERIEGFNSTYVKNDENDDTFNGTSSIEEETVNGVEIRDLSKKSSEDESIDTSPESKDKSKSTTKSDKLKKLELNKSGGSDLLPSLYSKEFKERGKDLDFDMRDDYEEDFMSGSDCSKPLLEELQQCSEFISKSKHLTNGTSSRCSSTDNNKHDSSVTNNIETSLSVDCQTGTSSKLTNSQNNDT